MSKIISIGTAVPEYGTKQSAIFEFMDEAYNDSTASRKLKILFNKSGITTRYSVLSDFGGSKPELNIFGGNLSAPTVDQRLNIYKRNAVSLAIEAIQNSLGKLKTTVAGFGITHLITVTCTGLYAPGIDTEIMEQLNLPNDIFHTSVNFMGCNAAFPALKLADMIARTDDNAKVMIVCVELCTLHFQPKNDHDNLLSNTIFGDGAAAVTIVSDAHAKQNHLPGMTINGFYSLLLSEGKDLMSWNITPLNFGMVLDARIPDFIGDHVDEILSRAGKRLNITPETISKWAIHPGGKKILDTIKDKLHLNNGDLKYSYKVLDEFGNMSSPTILFVLNEIMTAGNNAGEKVFSIGFGPGLSIETSVFTYAE